MRDTPMLRDEFSRIQARSLAILGPSCGPKDFQDLCKHVMVHENRSITPANWVQAAETVFADLLYTEVMGVEAAIMARDEDHLLVMP